MFLGKAVGIFKFGFRSHSVLYRIRRNFPQEDHAVFIIGNVGRIDPAANVFYSVLRQFSFQGLGLCRVINLKVLFIGIAKFCPRVIGHTP